MQASVLWLNLAAISLAIIFLLCRRLYRGIRTRSNSSPQSHFSDSPPYWYSVYAVVQSEKATVIPFPCPSQGEVLVQPTITRLAELGEDPRRTHRIKREHRTPTSLRSASPFPHATSPITVETEETASAEPTRMKSKTPDARKATPLNADPRPGSDRRHTQPTRIVSPTPSPTPSLSSLSAEEGSSSDTPAAGPSRPSGATKASSSTSWKGKGKEVDRPGASFEAGTKTYLRNKSTRENIETVWYQSHSESKIDAPPDATNLPDLRAGDLFMHKSPNKTQLWLWEVPLKGAGHWKPVEEFYTRYDKRMLLVTDKRGSPSWVSQTWGERKLRERGGTHV